jgi:hypothetical protein
MRARLFVVGALLALAGAPSAQARGCARTLPHGPHLPAPVVLRTVCGVFELRRDGSVVYGRAPARAPAWAPRATSHPDARTWVAHPNHRLAVYRDGRLLWHSHSTGGSDDVAVGHGHIAFTAYSRWTETLWIAPIGGRERMVAPKEDLIGWIPAGLVTQRESDLRLRAPDGRLLRSLARARTALRDGHGLIVLRTDGVIVRTDGWHTRTLTDLRTLGMAKDPWLEQLPGGLIQVMAGNRVLFLDRNGRRFASASFARPHKHDGGGQIVGGPLPLPDRSAIVFAVNRRRTWTDPGVETVYRLDRGHRVPRPLFATRLERLTCGQWATLMYLRGRVLFAASEGQTAVLDPAGRARPIDLTRLVSRLQPANPNPGRSSEAVWLS